MTVSVPRVRDASNNKEVGLRTLELSAKLLKKVPEDYASCFGLLACHNMIEKELSGKPAEMARFRNLLIHRYWEIEYVRLNNIIAGHDLNDLLEFVRNIKRVIEQTVQDTG